MDIRGSRRESFKSWAAAHKTNPRRISIKSGVPYNTVLNYWKGVTGSMGGDKEQKIAHGHNTTIEGIFCFGHLDSLSLSLLGLFSASGQLLVASGGNMFGRVTRPMGCPENAVAYKMFEDFQGRFRAGDVLVCVTGTPEIGDWVAAYRGDECTLEEYVEGAEADRWHIVKLIDIKSRPHEPLQEAS